MVRRVSRRYSSSKRVKSGRSRSLRKRVRSKSVRKIRRRRSKRMRGGTFKEGGDCSKEGGTLLGVDGVELICANVGTGRTSATGRKLQWKQAALGRNGTQSFKEQNTSGHIYEDLNQPLS